MAVAIKIRYTHQYPAVRKRWAQTTADVNVVVEIPNRCLMRAGILKHIVRVAVAVKVTYCSPGCTSSSRDERQCDEKWQDSIFLELSQWIHGSSFLWFRCLPFIAVKRKRAIKVII